MKVFTKAVLNDPYGNPLKHFSLKEGSDRMVDATLADVCIKALMTPHEADRGIDMKETVRRGALAVEFAQQDYVDLDTQQAALLQQLIHRLQVPAFFIAAYHLLEVSETPAPAAV